MRLLLVTVAVDEAELVADRAWQAGAAGLWEQATADGRTELRIGTDDPDGVIAALADLEPVDVTDDDAVELATRTVAMAFDDRELTLTVPPTVFGDGSHPTTATCVSLLSTLVSAGDVVVDVGCGTGFTTVAAGLAGGTVHAVDIDPAAVEATRANAATAGISITTARDLGGAPVADVVVANISAATLRSLREELQAVARPGALLVLSGMLADQWPGVRDAFGDEVVDSHTVDGWTTAVVRRPS